MNGINDKTHEQKLEELAELSRLHQLLDDNIRDLTLSPCVDQLELSRLKKRKLKLKDQIAKLRSSLIPDQHA